MPVRPDGGELDLGSAGFRLDLGPPGLWRIVAPVFDQSAPAL
jgi:hypothetical protein